MRRIPLVLVAAAVTATSSPGTALPASAAVEGAPFARLSGPVHTDWLRLKVFCFAGNTATVEFGLVSQPSDPDFGDPQGTPAPTNAARFEELTVPCTGKVRSVEVDLTAVPCPDGGCVPGLVKGVRADVFCLMDFGTDGVPGGDDEDFAHGNVRVV